MSKENDNKKEASPSVTLTITTEQLMEMLSHAAEKGAEAGARQAAMVIVAAEKEKQAKLELDSVNSSGLRGTGTGRQCQICKQPEHLRFKRFRFACCPDEKVFHDDVGLWKLTGRGTCEGCKAGKDCIGVHVKMVVWPRDQESYGPFPGIQINGVWYDSKAPNHPIWVPAQSDIAHQMLIFERAEKDLRLGRPINKMYPHVPKHIQG